MILRRALRGLGLAALVATIAWLGIGIRTGIRYPVLQHEPAGPLMQINFEESGVRVTAQGAYVEGVDNEVVRLRAYTPHPMVTVESDSAQPVSLQIGNIHPEAQLTTPPALTDAREQVAGLERRFYGTVTGRAEIAWRFPQRDRYRFAAIGDTGAGRELQWCLQRAADLGADFVFHLGDIYYPPDTLADGRDRFDRSPVPVYVAIGNHDFHRGMELLPAQYSRLFGPRNFSFRLLDTELVNLDTAASTFPVSGAQRGRLMAELPALGAPGTAVREYLVFTHRPLFDPRPGKSHDVGGREGRWLRERLAELGATTVIAGHIHRTLESREGPLTTYVAGDGLASVDLLAGRQVAQILIGELGRGVPPALRWEPLNMPFEAHCHTDAREALMEANRSDRLVELATACTGVPGWE